MITIKNDLEISIASLDLNFEKPSFIDYEPPFDEIINLAKPYQNKKNLLVIGYGGSNTSFKAYYDALYAGDKKVHILNTIDPDFLNKVKNSCPVSDTIVLAISKSGTTVDVIETVLFFEGYEIIVVTENKSSPLKKISEKKSYPFIAHPPIGGRFSARTPSGYLPAAILGLDIRAIDMGFKKGYTNYFSEKNTCLELAKSAYLLERKGYTEIFMPLYSQFLEGTSNLAIQLVHESSCKEEKGQTIYAPLAPESQHHTNQRVFGGRKNVIAFFVAIKKHSFNYVSKLSKEISQISYKEKDLSIFNGLSLSDSLHYELMGTYEDALAKEIPSALITLERVDEENIGEFIAFLQMYAVYASYLRGVNPYNQPQVEDSKKLTFEKILNHK